MLIEAAGDGDDGGTGIRLRRGHLLGQGGDEVGVEGDAFVEPVVFAYQRASPAIRLTATARMTAPKR